MIQLHGVGGTASEEQCQSAVRCKYIPMEAGMGRHSKAKSGDTRMINCSVLSFGKLLTSGSAVHTALGELNGRFSLLV